MAASLHHTLHKEATGRAFAFDIHVRRDLDEKVPANGIEVITRDIQEGVICNENGVKITASWPITAP